MLKAFRKWKPQKKFAIFQEMELFNSNIKNIQETETLVKICYISGNETS